MKIFFAVSLMLVLLFGVAVAKDYEVKKKAGAYDVTARIDRDPPVVGQNAISVEVLDAAGSPVTDAAVRVDYSMPAMPGMPPMNYRADAEIKGREYKAVMDLSMAGPWNIAVRIMRGGKTATMKFSIDAR